MIFFYEGMIFSLYIEYIRERWKYLSYLKKIGE